MSKKYKINSQYEKNQKDGNGKHVFDLPNQMLIHICEYVDIDDLIGMYWTHRRFQFPVQKYWSTPGVYLSNRLCQNICRYFGTTLECRQARFWESFQIDEVHLMGTGLLRLITNEHSMVSSQSCKYSFIYLYEQQNIDYSLKSEFQRKSYEENTEPECFSSLLKYSGMFRSGERSHRIREQHPYDQESKTDHAEYFCNHRQQTCYDYCTIDKLCAFPSIFRELVLPRLSEQWTLKFEFYGMDSNIYDLKRLRNSGQQFDVLNLSFNGKHLHLGNVAGFYHRQARMMHDIHRDLDNQRKDFIRYSIQTAHLLEDIGFDVFRSEEWLTKTIQMYQSYSNQSLHELNGSRQENQLILQDLQVELNEKRPAISCDPSNDRIGAPAPRRMFPLF